MSSSDSGSFPDFVPYSSDSPAEYPDYLPRMDSATYLPEEQPAVGRHGRPDTEAVEPIGPNVPVEAGGGVIPGDRVDVEPSPPDTSPVRPDEASEASFALQELADLVGQVHARLDRVENALQVNAGTVERNYEQSLTALRDRAVAAEIGISQNLLRPLTRRVASLIDRAELECVKRQADPWVLIATLVEELQETLEDFGVETISCEVGMQVDKARHRVARNSPERLRQDDSLRIVERIRHGYELSGYVLRPAEVVAEWVPADAPTE